MKSLQLGNDRKSDFKKSKKFKAGNFFLRFFFKNDTKLKELFNSLFYFMEYTVVHQTVLCVGLL
jgi:hypothetical protein